jgi:hypothetical protein
LDLQFNYPVITAEYFPTAYGNTPVAITNLSAPSEGVTTSIVTEQTAKEFQSYKKQLFEAELNQLKSQIHDLEQKLGDDNK